MMNCTTDAARPAEIDLPALKDRLWHKMQTDLAQYVPDVVDRKLLMCCACGRFLPIECFDVDHIIPQQTIKQDPLSVRENPETPAITRSGSILLCTKPLHFKGSKINGRGCNSWKGRYFDGPMTEIFTGRAAKNPRTPKRTAHIIGGLAIGYLGMVEQFGYLPALMHSGLILREQFFNPGRFHKALGSRCQIILMGDPKFSHDDPVWKSPFQFEKHDDSAWLATVRNFVVYLPVSRDPRVPVPRHLPIIPHRLVFRPNFETWLT